MSTQKIEINIPERNQNKRLDKFLMNLFPNVSFGNLQKLVRKKDIRVNGRKTETNYKLEVGDNISLPKFIYDSFLRGDENKKKSQNDKKGISDKKVKEFLKTVVYKDENIIAINKPQGLAVQGGSNIKASVVDYLPCLKFEKQEKPRLVHRIDKDTSGLLLIARNSEMCEKLAGFFKEKNKIRKIYLAIVVGKLPKNKGTISHPLIKKFNRGIEKVYKDNQLGKEAITNFRVISYSKKFNVSLVEVEILTGRTHQIRVHFKEFGHPILGDGKYGGKKAFVEGLGDKMHLHSYKIEIEELGLKLKAEFPLKFLKTIRKAGLKL